MRSADAASRAIEAWLEPVSARPWVIAHRGDSAHAPENTIEAARLAWEAGAEAWELDVQLTRDGVAIVLHDASLRQTTDVASWFRDDPRADGGFLVADFDWEEVQRLDAGIWFIDPLGGPRSAAEFGTLDRMDTRQIEQIRSGGIRVPALGEALALTVRLDWRVNVELKLVPTSDERLVDVVLREVERAGAARHALLSSFDHGAIARIVEERPDLATGMLSATPLHRPEIYVRENIGAGAYHPSIVALGAGSLAYMRERSSRNLRTEEIRALRCAGVPVFAYALTGAETELANHLAECGATGIFADAPGRLIEHWGRGRRAALPEELRAKIDA